MYIIAIGWLWVALLLAITESSVTAGLITLFLWGLLPCGLMLWFSGTRVRRERQAYRLLTSHALEEHRHRKSRDLTFRYGPFRQPTDKFLHFTARESSAVTLAANDLLREHVRGP